MALVLLAGCMGRSPTQPFSGGSTGASGGSVSQSALVGTWHRVEVVTTSMDITSSETTWTFSAGGSCARTVTTNTVSAGMPLSTSTDCTYSVSNGAVHITFTGAASSVSFSIAFSGGALLLNGLPFSRVG